MPRGYDGPSGDAGYATGSIRGMGNDRSKATARVMVASPLEAEHAARIADAFPDRAEVVYRPDLLPPTLYRGDHDGDPAWTRTPEQQREWLELLAGADVLWDF